MNEPFCTQDFYRWKLAFLMVINVYNVGSLYLIKNSRKTNVEIPPYPVVLHSHSYNKIIQKQRGIKFDIVAVLLTFQDSKTDVVYW